MKVGTKVFALGLLTVISAWGLSGCSNEEPAPIPPTETRNKVAAKGDEHAKLGEAKTAGHQRQEHRRPDHKMDGHGMSEHGHHGHGAHGLNEPPPPGSVKIGDNVPDFAVRTLDGKSAKLSELQKDERRTKQGIVVLSFWCTTCHSCRDVEHLLAKLSKDYEGQAAVIALGANADETAESVDAFVKKKGLELPVVLDPSGHTADLFGVNTTTTTVVIDGNGVLRYCGQFRQKDGGSAEEALKAVLAGEEVAITTTPHNG
jgi:peroxiredoxin